MGADPQGAGAELEPEHDVQTMKRRTVHGAAATMAAQAIRFVVQFSAQVMLAHLLLPADFGLVAMITPVLNFVGIFNELGLSQATIQRVEISQGELSALFWINTGVSVALAAIMAALSPVVALFYGDPRLVSMCAVISVLLVISGLSTQHVALINRRMRFTYLAVMDVACAVMALLGGVGAAVLGCGYWSLVIAQAANALTILVLSWLLSGWRPSWPARQAGVGAMLRFGGHITGYNVINFIGTNCDGVVIGRLSGSVALGLYDRAYKLVASPIWQISLPVDRVAASLLARLQTSADRYRAAFVQMLQMLLLVTTPAVICVAIASETLVPLLLGHAWGAAAPIVSGLAIATGFAPLSISSYWLFVSQGRAGEQVRYVIIRTVISVTALLVGAHWGPVGVARAYAGAAVVMHSLPLLGAVRTGPVSRRDVWRGCYPMLVGTAAAVAGLLICQPRLEAAGVDGVARLAILFGLAYACFGAPLLCWPDGQRILGAIWRLRSVFGRAAVAAE